MRNLDNANAVVELGMYEGKALRASSRRSFWSARANNWLVCHESFLPFDLVLGFIQFFYSMTSDFVLRQTETCIVLYTSTASV